MPIFRVQSLPDSAELFELNIEDAKHLTRVLRVKQGDTFEVMLPSGAKARAQLCLEEGRYLAQLQSILSEHPETQIPLHLGVGLLRWPRIEWLIEKSTELGVESVTLLTLKHCRISKQDKISTHKLERLKRIAEETLKQCERYRAPEIKVATLELFLKAIPSHSQKQLQKILFNEKIKEPKFHPEFLIKRKKLDSEYVFLIGPEGGFAEEETQLAIQSGFFSVSLGETLIRAETAALYATCVLSSIL